MITEDGQSFAEGDRLFNYYDMKAGVVGPPDPFDWWFDFHHDDGTRTSLDGTRVCTIAFAQRKGWI